MAFCKVSMVMAVLASACAAPAPQYYNYAAVPPPPPPPAVRTVVAAVPPPPPAPPAHYHAATAYHAAPAPFVPIVSQSYDASPEGNYVFQYESADGSARQEQGYARSPPGHEGPGGVAVQGRFTYQSESGPVQVEYIADENGYQPTGNNIHPEIVKAVAAQVAFARSEPPTAYNAPPAAYARTYAVPPPPPPPARPVFATAAPSPYPFKA